MTRTALVTGAGGFIGFHLVNYLAALDYRVRGVDLRLPDFGETGADEFKVIDLRERDSCESVVRGIDEVYHLAADMGGIGYITASHATVARNNILIDVNVLESAHRAGVDRFFYSSSACVYPSYLQDTPEVSPLKEATAYPADAEKGYGWEKLWMEQLCQYYQEDFGFKTRVARFHNIYGPFGTYEGGREKAPAAICRKVALASDGDEVEVWGDGEQSRSFTYIDDCVEGIYRIARSEDPAPFNLGTEELITVNELYDLIASIAGKQIVKRHDRSKPQGVRGRNSDNTRSREVLGWEAQTTLREGLPATYGWIVSQLEGAGRIRLSARAPRPA
jgi:GDP-D-mannose 3', 5'-epimerase